MTPAEQALLDALALLNALRPVQGSRDSQTWQAAWERAWRDALAAAEAYVRE